MKTPFLLGAFILAVSACGAQKESDPAPQYGVQPTLSELDALEHELVASEQRLDEQLSLRTHALAETSGQPSTPAPSASAPPPPPAPVPDGTDEEPPAQAEPKAPAPTDAPRADDSPANRAALAAPCDLACRALFSMRRSSQRICELTAPDDERCARSRSRVAAAEERIRRARCECLDERG